MGQLHTRRSVLKTAGALGVIGLGGCTEDRTRYAGDGGDGGGGGGDGGGGGGGGDGGGGDGGGSYNRETATEPEAPREVTEPSECHDIEWVETGGMFDGGSFAVEAENYAQTAGQVADTIEITVRIHESEEKYGAYEVYIDRQKVGKLSLAEGEYSFVKGRFEERDPGEYRYDIEIRFVNSDTFTDKRLATTSITVTVVEDLNPC